MKLVRRDVTGGYGTSRDIIRYLSTVTSEIPVETVCLLLIRGLVLGSGLTGQLDSDGETLHHGTHSYPNYCADLLRY